MTSIEFHRRPSSYGDDRAGSLFVRVIRDRRTRSVTLPYRLYASEWDERRRCVVMEPGGIQSNAGRLERMQWLAQVAEHLEEERRLLRSIVRRLEACGTFTAYEVGEIYRRHKAGTFLSVFTGVLSAELISSGRERTARAYRSVTNRILRFRCGKDILLKEITPVFLMEFQNAILAEGRSLNTVSFYMRNLRAIYNKGVKDGLIDAAPGNPFEEVYTGIQHTSKRALTKQELALLELSLNSGEPTTPTGTGNIQSTKAQVSGTFLPDKLDKAIRLFMFSFLARGMSFVDMAYLRKEDIREGRIIYKRKKTGSMLNLKVTSHMHKIIRSFEAETQHTPFVFPIICDKELPFRRQYENGLRLQNRRLKRIAALCNIKKTLSTHVARHTWATLARRENIPLSVISEGLGHTSEKTTAIYLACFEHITIDRAGDKVTKAVMKKAV